MKNEIKLVFKGHTSNEWNALVLDLNQDFDEKEYDLKIQME